MLAQPEKIGPYRILRKLGEGGMGAVFEGFHDAIERQVAIKILHRQFTVRPEQVARFFNEARAVNRIGHPGIVQISDFGSLADGTAYLVMEFLNGESLGGRRKRSGGKLSPADTMRLGILIADALSAAHKKGIIHRDL